MRSFNHGPTAPAASGAVVMRLRHTAQLLQTKSGGVSLSRYLPKSLGFRVSDLGFRA